MRAEKFKQLVAEAIDEYLGSPAGEARIGTIMLKAADQALRREIRFEDGKSEPGRVVEKVESWNILDWLAKYQPDIEAAIRGCQADSASARNTAAEVRDGVRLLADALTGFAGEALIVDAGGERRAIGMEG